MAANAVLIVSAIVSLIYLSQKLLLRYSVLAFLALVAAYPLYIALGRLVVTLAGDNARSWYAIAVYFSPIPAAVAVRYSVFQRVNLRRIRLPWNLGPRSFDDYDNPDDALAAAARLDLHGDWAASIDLYRLAAQRWPRHAEYIDRCINRIVEKRSLQR